MIARVVYPRELRSLCLLCQVNQAISIEFFRRYGVYSPGLDTPIEFSFAVYAAEGCVGGGAEADDWLKSDAGI